MPCLTFTLTKMAFWSFFRGGCRGWWTYKCPLLEISILFVSISAFCWCESWDLGYISWLGARSQSQSEFGADLEADLGVDFGEDFVGMAGAPGLNGLEEALLELTVQASKEVKSCSSLVQHGRVSGSFPVTFKLAPLMWSLVGAGTFLTSFVLESATASDLGWRMSSSCLWHFTSGLIQCEKNVIVFPKSTSGASGRAKIFWVWDLLTRSPSPGPPNSYPTSSFALQCGPDTLGPESLDLKNVAPSNTGLPNLAQ